MELNKISSEMMIKMGLMNKAIKNMVGDGMEFDIMYQSLLKATVGKENLQNINDNIMTSVAGQSLEAMDMLISGADYKNNYRNTSSLNDNIKTEELSDIKPVNMESKDSKMQNIYSSVNKYSKEYGVDPNFVLGIIKAESSFNPNTKSGAGAMGLMQLMPGTAEFLGVKNPYDIDENIKGGVKYITDKLKQYGGSKEMALMAYNAGSGTMQKRGVKSADDLYKMPLETRNYIPKVMGYYNDFRNKSI